jgi:hypothetical protein
MDAAAADGELMCKDGGADEVVDRGDAMMDDPFDDAADAVFALTVDTNKDDDVDVLDADEDADVLDVDV